jgi:hypothetical protein
MKTDISNLPNGHRFLIVVVKFIVFGATVITSITVPLFETSILAEFILHPVCVVPSGRNFALQPGFGGTR